MFESEEEELPKRVVFDILNYAYLSHDDIRPNPCLHMATPENTLILSEWERKRQVQNESKLKMPEYSKKSKNPSEFFPLRIPLKAHKEQENDKLTLPPVVSYLYPFHEPSKQLKNTFLSIRAQSLQPDQKLKEETFREKVKISPNVRAKVKPRQKAGFKFDNERFRFGQRLNLDSPPKNVEFITTSDQTIFKKNKPTENFKLRHRKMVEMSNSISGEISKIIYKYPSIFVRRSKTRGEESRKYAEKKPQLPLLITNSQKKDSINLAKLKAYSDK